MATLSFPVRRREPELVGPAAPTPRETKRLSDLDDEETLRSLVPVIHFYRGRTPPSDDDPAGVIRRALAAALVPYYPLAGRLREEEGRKLVVDCTGEGVAFVEADADVRLAELEQAAGGGLSAPFPCVDQLLPNIESSRSAAGSLLLVQVTRLQCGGFVFALRFHHAMCDTIGAVQFMAAVGELARGLPTAPPAWSRELLMARSPPAPAFPHREFDVESFPRARRRPAGGGDLVTRTFAFSPGDIAAIRRRGVTTATTYEVLAAFLWRARTAALEIPPSEEVRLVVVANFRGLAGLLPAGYYGNACVVPAAVTTAGALTDGSLAAAVELVREAKAAVTAEYVRSTADVLVLRGRPFLAVANTLVVSDHRHAGYGRVDLGWGRPVYGGPAGPLFMLSYLVAGENGAVGLQLALPRPAMERFASEVAA